MDTFTPNFRGVGNLGDLVAELERQQASRIDFVADTRQLRVKHHDGDGCKLRLVPASPQVSEWLPAEGVPISSHALGQIASIVDPSIPVRFARDLLAMDPKLCCKLVDDLLSKRESRKLVRVLDGTVRAILSDRYRILDSNDLAFAALDVAKDVKAYPIKCELTDNNMRLQLTTREVWDKVDAQMRGDRKTHWAFGGDASPERLDRLGLRGSAVAQGGVDDIETVHPLVTISNSETGSGGLNVSIGLLRAWCINGCVMERSISRVHLGGKLDQGLFRPETVDLDNRAIMAKASDAIRAAFHPSVFGGLVAKANHASSVAIQAPATAVANIVTNSGLDESEMEGILNHFMNYDSTAYGLAQAVSRASQDTQDAERVSALESLAGSIIDSPESMVCS